MARDPVCGMDVDETASTLKVEHDGKTHYFCSDSCRKKFQESPANYVPEQGGGGEVY